MQANIVRSIALLILTVISSRNLFGQTDSLSGSLNISDDSSRVPVLTTVNYRHGRLYTVQLAGDSVRSLKVDGQLIQRNNWDRYREVIERIQDQVGEARIQIAEDRLQLLRDRRQLQRDQEQVARNMEQLDQNRKQALQQEEQAERNLKQAELSRRMALQDMDYGARSREQAERDRDQAGRDKEQAERDRKNAEEDRKMMYSLCADLVKDGIVPDRESVHSLELDQFHVSVNGKRLPDALEKKYIERYSRGNRSMVFHRGEEN